MVKGKIQEYVGFERRIPFIRDGNEAQNPNNTLKEFRKSISVAFFGMFDEEDDYPLEDDDPLDYSGNDEWQSFLATQDPYRLIFYFVEFFKSYDLRREIEKTDPVKMALWDLHLSVIDEIEERLNRESRLLERFSFELAFELSDWVLKIRMRFSSDKYLVTEYLRSRLKLGELKPPKLKISTAKEPKEEKKDYHSESKPEETKIPEEIKKVEQKAIVSESKPEETKIPEEIKEVEQIPTVFAGEAAEKFNEISNEVRQVAQELKEKGVKEAKLILAIDCTASNNLSGKKSFNGKPMHEISKARLNFYEQVIGIMGSIVNDISPGVDFPVYLFGDSETKDTSVRPLYVGPDGSESCSSVEHALIEYRKIISTVGLSGPTSFRPAIEKAMELTKGSSKFHLLIIIGDGAATDIEPNAQAIKDASEYPISILMIGVGDGDVRQNPDNPWEGMGKLDSVLPDRKFNNFKFVQYVKDMKAEELAKSALKEIPNAYEYCEKNGLIK